MIVIVRVFPGEPALHLVHAARRCVGGAPGSKVTASTQLHQLNPGLQATTLSPSQRQLFIFLPAFDPLPVPIILTDILKTSCLSYLVTPLRIVLSWEPSLHKNFLQIVTLPTLSIPSISAISATNSLIACNIWLQILKDQLLIAVVIILTQEPSKKCGE